MAVKLTDLIGPAFYEVWQAIKAKTYVHYWLNGGRSSGKSSFISLAIVLLIMQDPEANAICFRKVGETLRDSVYEQILWAISQLGVSDEFSATVSPMQITYKRTGQKLLFRGLDKAEKTKSIKLRRGYFKIAWFEELAEFAGIEEVRKATQSVMRGGKDYVYFYSYNPPITTANWVNVEAGRSPSNRLVHHSTYLQMPAAWIGEAQLLEAEHLKKNNPRAYQHEYLGEATGTGGSVFPNVKALKMTDQLIATFSNIRQGIDWGYVADPFAYVKLHYDKTRRSIYIFDEIYGLGLTNPKAIPLVKAKADIGGYIYADSAEPKSVQEFWDAGLYVAGAKKGPGSVEYGIKFLQGMDNIFIDPERCPNAWREFSCYELEKDKSGEWKTRPPDKNNHCLIAGTLIRVRGGYKPIETVTENDEVLTRKGFLKVLWTGETGKNRDVLRLTTSAGAEIVATPDHKVFTSRGFKRMDELEQGDKVLLEKQWLKSFLHTAERGEDTPNQREEATGSISKVGANTYITLYGKNLSAHEKAEKSSQAISTKKCDFAADRVLTVEPAGVAPKVYDITVKGQHEFIANGILVHNCIDATSYSLNDDKGIYV